jgi:hypothetical protein
VRTIRLDVEQPARALDAEERRNVRRQWHAVVEQPPLEQTKVKQWGAISMLICAASKDRAADPLATSSK